MECSASTANSAIKRAQRSELHAGRDLLWLWFLILTLLNSSAVPFLRNVTSDLLLK